MRQELTAIAARCDEQVAAARAELVAAVRRAHSEGLTQAEIARQIGRSQPEVSRLLRFHGTSPTGRALRQHAPEVRRIIAEAGGRNVRVFGSLATGSDGPSSDVDLLFTMGRPLGLMELSALELRLGELLSAEVDLLTDQSLRPAIREGVLAEAVAL